MPTAEHLAQLQTLLNQLLPIAQTRPGELIRADDWNTLVGSVMSLARTLLQQDEAAAVPPHDHLDQVTADWLVPSLRDQLQRGPLADPAMPGRPAHDRAAAAQSAPAGGRPARGPDRHLLHRPADRDRDTRHRPRVRGHRRLAPGLGHRRCARGGARSAQVHRNGAGRSGLGADRGAITR